MKCRNSPDTIGALYRVFVLPALSPSNSLPSRPLAQQTLQNVQRAGQHQCQHRAFATTPRTLVKTRPPEPARGNQKWDEDITAQIIMLVDPETNKLSEEPRTRFDILNSLDRRTHRLLQVSAGDGHGGPAVCKIINKKEAFEAEKRRKQQQKESRKEKKVLQSVKTLELNWAIDGNDLGHRLAQMVDFLAEGRKVEIVLAAKKQGRKATRAECEGVLGRIREAVEGVQGAKEVRLDGKVGGFVTMMLQGKPQAQEKVG